MAQTIRVTVLTQQGLAFEEEAVSVIAHGEQGFVGIQRSHAPMVALLSPGRLIWQRASGERKEAQLGSGLLEVVNDRITILTERAGDPAPSRR